MIRVIRMIRGDKGDEDDKGDKEKSVYSSIENPVGDHGNPFQTQ